MQRFFGMMPCDEIEIEKYFVDNNMKKVILQAGPNGWTVIYADGGTEFLDISDTTEANFKAAYNAAVEHLGELKEI